MLALTSSQSSSSPGVESNQNNVTCFDLIRSHQTRLLVRRQEVRKTLKSSASVYYIYIHYNIYNGYNYNTQTTTTESFLSNFDRDRMNQIIK